MKNKYSVIYFILGIILMEGCYTQLATYEEDQTPRRRSKPRANYYTETDTSYNSDSKTTIINNYNYFEDDDFRRSRYRASFHFYNPHWNYGWYDPFYYQYSWHNDWDYWFNDPWGYNRHQGMYVGYPYPYWYQPNYFGYYSPYNYYPYYYGSGGYSSNDDLESRRRGGGSGNSRGDDNSFRDRPADIPGTSVATSVNAPAPPTGTRTRDEGNKNPNDIPTGRERELPWWKKVEEMNMPTSGRVREKEKINIDDDNSGNRGKVEDSKKEPSTGDAKGKIKYTAPKTPQPSTGGTNVRGQSTPTTPPPPSNGTVRKRED